MAANMAAQPRSDELLNQSPPYVDVDLYTSDQPLRSAVADNGGEGDAAALSAFGRHWGSAAMFELARQANENPPKLKTLRRQGLSPRFHRVSSGLSRSDGRERRRRSAGVDVARRRDTGGRTGAGHPRRSLLHGGAGGDRTSLPHHHDARRGRGAGGRATAGCQADAEDRVAALRRSFPSMVGEDRHHARHGNDGKARRHRRARQPHARAAHR